ncbi:MAG: phytanoyl-CoA dioxygenase, partial [Bacteroidetes bacterium]
MKKLQCPDFILGEKLTEEQLAFFDKNGVIVFRNVLKK